MEIETVWGLVQFKHSSLEKLQHNNTPLCYIMGV